MDMYDGKFTVGDTVAIVGGGLAGTEAAIELAMEGKRVTLVEMAADIAREANSIHKPHLMRKIATLTDNLTILRSTTCDEITDAGIRCTGKDGQSITVSADTVILSVGMRALSAVADELEAVSRDFRQIGDCKRARQIGDAVREGYDAAMNI